MNSSLHELIAKINCSVITGWISTISKIRRGVCNPAVTRYSSKRDHQYRLVQSVTTLCHEYRGVRWVLSTMLKQGKRSSQPYFQSHASKASNALPTFLKAQRPLIIDLEEANWDLVASQLIELGSRLITTSWLASSAQQKRKRCRERTSKLKLNSLPENQMLFSSSCSIEVSSVDGTFIAGSRRISLSFLGTLLGDRKLWDPLPVQLTIDVDYIRSVSKKKFGFLATCQTELSHSVGTQTL